MAEKVTVTPLPVEQRLELFERSFDRTTVIGATSTLVCAANPRRTALWLVNDSGEAIYLALGGRAAVMNKGIRLNAAGGCLEINKSNLTKEAVYAICTSGSMTLVGTELESSYANI